MPYELADRIDSTHQRIDGAGNGKAVPPIREVFTFHNFRRRNNLVYPGLLGTVLFPAGTDEV